MLMERVAPLQSEVFARTSWWVGAAKCHLYRFS